MNVTDNKKLIKAMEERLNDIHHEYDIKQIKLFEKHLTRQNLELFLYDLFSSIYSVDDFLLFSKYVVSRKNKYQSLFKPLINIRFKEKVSFFKQVNFISMMSILFPDYEKEKKFENIELPKIYLNKENHYIFYNFDNKTEEIQVFFKKNLKNMIDFMPDNNKIEFLLHIIDENNPILLDHVLLLFNKTEQKQFLKNQDISFSISLKCEQHGREFELLDVVNKHLPLLISDLIKFYINKIKETTKNKEELIDTLNQQHMTTKITLKTQQIDIDLKTLFNPLLKIHIKTLNSLFPYMKDKQKIIWYQLCKKNECENEILPKYLPYINKIRIEKSINKHLANKINNKVYKKKNKKM